jgi:hypothetical protein
MSVRAKFVCDEVTKTRYGSARVSLYPVSNGSEENEQFWKYTPSGKIELSIENPSAAERFEPGKEYYVDFTPAE